MRVILERNSHNTTFRSGFHMKAADRCSKRSRTLRICSNDMTPYHFLISRLECLIEQKNVTDRIFRRRPYGKSGKGFSLIEMLVYVAVVAIIMSSVLAVIFPLAGTYHSLIATKRLNISAESVLDRMLREIRSASSVNTDAGSRAFSVDASGALTVSEGGVSAGKLTGEEVTVSRLVFTRVPGTRSELVSVELALHSRYGHATTTRTFRGSAVLRDSY